MNRVKLESQKYFLKEKNWLLSEERVFDTETDSMLAAKLMIVDLNTMSMVEGIDDVWEYNWTIILNKIK